MEIDSNYNLEYGSKEFSEMSNMDIDIKDGFVWR